MHAKEIAGQVSDYASKARHEKKSSPIKNIEKAEDEQDVKEYLKKLKK